MGDPIEILDECDTVIMMLHEMGHDAIQRSPGIEYDTNIEYSKEAWCASSLATFISEIGCRAVVKSAQYTDSIVYLFNQSTIRTRSNSFP